jgi:hypothetical protein
MTPTIDFKEAEAGRHLIGLRIDYATSEKIKRVADQQNTTASAVIRAFIKFGLKTLSNQTN